MDESIAHSGRAHARMSASATERFWNCPGSVMACADMPDVSSDYAREGTAAHEIAQICLESGQDALEFVDRTVGATESEPGFLFDEEWAEAIQIYLDECRARMIPGLQEWWIERRISLAVLNPPDDMFGTADFVSYDPFTGTLYVHDFKFGRGISVSIESNKQLRYYALGVMIGLSLDRPVRRIVMKIVQPRISYGKKIKEAETTPEALIEWSLDLMDHAAIALSPDAPFRAGEWCRSTFCKRDGKCRVQATAAVEFTGKKFAEAMDAENALVDPTTLSGAELGLMLDRLEAFRTFAKAVEEVASGMLAWDPQSVPGWGLMPTEARRQWKEKEDETAVAASLANSFGLSEEQIWKRKVITPAMAQAAIKANLRVNGMKAGEAETEAKTLLKAIAESKSSGTKLVPVAKATVPLAARGLVDLFPTEAA